MTYTALSLLGVAFAVALDIVLLRTFLLRRKAFWVAYAIVLAGQLLTNGVLTATRTVRYSSSAILGGSSPVGLGDYHVAWAPLEDLLFGFSLVLQTLAWWVFWGRLSARSARPRGVEPGATGDPEPSA
jgi:lycopene cyclase domain-containing protein